MTEQIVPAAAPRAYPFQTTAQLLGGSMPTTGRWGWYQDHDGQSFRRVSTLIKEVETDNYNLDQWKLRQVAEGMSVRDDLVLALKAMGRPPLEGWTRAQKADIDAVAERAMEAAKTTDGATTGTAMHTLTERVDRGELIDAAAAGLPAGAAQSLRAYAHLRELNGWRTVEIERTVVCDELEVAGTFDRVDYLPELAGLLGPGECQYGDQCPDVGLHGGDLPVIVDVKTEKDPTQNGLHIGPQLAIYSRAKRMWRPTSGTRMVNRGEQAIEVQNGEYVPAPCVRQDVAVVVHVGNGDANPLLVNLTEGWAAAVAAHEQINRKARAKRRVGAKGAWFAPLPTKRATGLTTLVETAAAAGYADPNRPGPGQVGEVVTVAGIDFTRIQAAPIAWGDPAPRSAAAIAAAPTPNISGAELVGGHGPMPSIVNELTDTARQLIAAIWQARTLDGLAILWNMAGDRGVAWAGPVAMAGDARRRQIECVQRAMHVAGTVKCACGWMAGQIA
jgi:hypothetical protein